MKLQIKYDIHQACKTIMQEQLRKMGIDHEIGGIGEITLKTALSKTQLQELETAIKKYGIEIIDNPRNTFVQKVKDLIVEMIYLEDELPNSKISAYISGKLNHSYGYISNIFSETTFTSIENFIILQRIERAKQEIVEGKYTLTEIAWKLNYSSVAHLSNQFKKTTGLTPSAFQRIIKMRNSQDNNT